MLRRVALFSLIAVLAYVYSKPAVLHRWQTAPLASSNFYGNLKRRAKRWEEFPNVTFTFDCGDKAVGFYADVEHGCQIFHMCDEDGRRIPYICANDTSFNQQYRICDWNYNFDCEDAPNWFYLNELTYVTDPPKEKTRRQ